MNKPRVWVDFNEMVSDDDVLLSKTDTKADSDGNIVTFTEGCSVSVYDEDLDEHGQPDNIIADGVAMLNTYGGWTAPAKWLIKIDSRGVRHESDDAD